MPSGHGKKGVLFWLVEFKGEPCPEKRAPLGNWEMDPPTPRSAHFAATACHDGELRRRDAGAPVVVGVDADAPNEKSTGPRPLEKKTGAKAQETNVKPHLTDKI